MKADSILTRPGLRSAVFKHSLFSTHTAKLISDVLSPPLVGLITFLLVGIYVGTTNGWLWISGFIGTMLAAPTLFVVWMVKTGQAVDFHLPNREERIQPLCFTVLVTLISCLAAWRLGASEFILLIGYINIVQSIIVLLITLRWKISVHCTAAAMFTMLFLYLYGSVALLVAPIVPIIAWSRLHLRRHTLNQSIGGALLGFAIVLCVVIYTG